MLSTKIKSHTSVAHQQLEKIVITKLKAIRSDQDYADLLQYFYAYFNALEMAIEPFISENTLPDYRERRKAHRLFDDIQHLGESINRSLKPSLPNIANTAEAMGALYVMEGSVMGGPIIIGMLEKYGIKKGFSFFSGYKQHTGEMWGKFINALNANVHNKETEKQAMESATQTFSKFADLFNQELT